MRVERAEEDWRVGHFGASTEGTTTMTTWRVFRQWIAAATSREAAALARMNSNLQSMMVVGSCS
jgi:hypothetical protein